MISKMKDIIGLSTKLCIAATVAILLSLLIFCGGAGAVSTEKKILMFLGGDSIPADVVFCLTATDGVLKSKRGPGLTYSAAAGSVPNGVGGVQSSTVPPIHSAGYYAGPAYTNLFSGGPTGAAVVALTAQKYCLQCVGGSVDAGAYGTATPSAPLIFTASAGNQEFTPTGSTSWMLSAAGGYVFPIIPPGQSVVSTAGTVGGNGLSVPMTGSSAADALNNAFDGSAGNNAVGTVAILMKIGASSANMTSTNQPIVTAADGSLFMYFRNSAGGSPLRSFDGTNLVVFEGAAWDRDEYHLKIIEYNINKLRIGHRRYTSAGVPIDANIVWSHATLAGGAAFDGSFSPGTVMRLLVDFYAPQYLRCMMVSNQHSLGDAEILARLEKYGKF